MISTATFFEGDAQQTGLGGNLRRRVQLIDALREEIPDDSVIMGDIAQLVHTGTDAIKTLLPRTWFYPAGFGTLGCALPDAIGAKLAVADKAVIDWS